MLTARRDPLLHPGVPDAALPAHHPGHGVHPGHAAHSPGFSRFMTFLQVAGSLLAIPLGLASGYSIYHSNFSVEARCQGLRANIVSMLDKSADASTLRILVRRDVANFERSCGAVDPDAVAAFKTLLAGGKMTASAGATGAVASPQHAAAAPARQQHEMAKAPPPLKAPPAEMAARSLRHDATISDANWLAAVRRALIHAPVPRAEAGEVTAPVPAVAPQLRGPALPRAASVVSVPAPASDAGHPVPPASIPVVVPLPKVSEAAPAERQSGFSGLLAQFPLLGRLVGHQADGR